MCPKRSERKNKLSELERKNEQIVPKNEWTWGVVAHWYTWRLSSEGIRAVSGAPLCSSGLEDTLQK